MPDAAPEPFAVKDCALIAIATGRRALTCGELLDVLRTVDGGSVYYHFWGGLLQPRFEEREFNNDFAAWARHQLHDDALAERLALVDPTQHADSEELRRELIEVIEERMDESVVLAWLRAQQPFAFIRSQIVVFDSRRRPATPQELAAALPSFSAGSVFYHFIDARRRTPGHVDDFRLWLAGFGEDYGGLCADLAAIDPFFQPLSELRGQIAAVLARSCGEAAS